MRTDASREQTTQSISATDQDDTDSTTTSQIAQDSTQSAASDAELGDDSLLISPSVPATLTRTTTSRSSFSQRVQTFMEGFSLDERLGRIILSIVLAALLGVYVTSLENPAHVTQFSGLTVDVRGLASNLKVINTMPLVNVTVQAPQSIMNALRESDVRPYVDLAPLGAGVHEVPVTVDINGLEDRNAANISVAPRSVQVQLEVQATRSFSVTAQVIGTPAFGYSVDPAQVDPSQVSVTGPENDVNRIAKVVVTVDVEQKAATQRGFKTPVALDSAGQEITGLTFQPPAVQVVVPIKLLVSYRLVPVHVPIVGNPAPGYSAYEIKLDPSNVTICCAPSDILEPISTLETDPVSIAGATTTVVTTTKLILPSGVELYPGQSDQISVTVRIDTFETSWQLSVAPTIDGLDPGTTFVLSPATIELTLSGTLAQFESLKPSDVHASVDVTGLGPGTYELEPQVTVPDGVKLTAVNPQKVTVTLIPPTPVPPTPTPVPTHAPTATPLSATPARTPSPSSSPSASTPTATPTQPQSPTPTHTVAASPTQTATTTPTPTVGSATDQIGTPAPQPTP